MVDYSGYARSFDDPASAQQSLEKIALDMPEEGLVFLGRFVTEALQEPIPQDILRRFERLSAAVISKPAFFRMLSDYPPVLVRLIRLFSTSHYLGDILIRDPELVSLLVSPEISCPPMRPDRLKADFSRITSNTVDSISRKLDRLRMAKRREILKIGIRDYILQESFDHVTVNISLLARTCVESVLTLHAGALTMKYGQTDTPFAVIALGKLGGTELNYSSDIDLMFVYRDEGRVSATTYHEFFNELAAAILSSLSARTREGVLYRADARLRPDGNAGPLARSEASMMHYYEARGQLWERQMLIKARPIAGDLEYGERFLHNLLPFVYPRSTLSSPLVEIARMKWRIEERERGDFLNIKSCPGGIRDIEFIVQALQLIHGGHTPQLRNPNTLAGLKNLYEAGLMTIQEFDALRQAYVFYRQIEHLLQIDHDLQTHTLPDSPEMWQRLGALKGFSSPEDFQEALDRNRLTVRQLYDSVFQLDVSETDDTVTMLFSDSLSKDHSARLHKAGFESPSQAYRALRQLCFGEFPRHHSNAEQQAFIRLLSTLLKEILALPDPDHTVVNFARLVSRHAAKEAFYKSLDRKRNLRQTLLHLSALSPFLTNILCDQPACLDLIESRLDQWSSGTCPPGHQISSQFGGLYALKALEYLRIIVADYHASITQDDVHNQLTDLADSILTNRFGAFFDPSNPIVVVGLGKLGGRELSFKSDLDVVFVCSDDADVDDLIARAKAYLNDISQITPTGKLYDIDARLRPEGKQAPLVVTLSRYQNYITTRAGFWEKQALVKARVVCGDSATSVSVRSFFDGILAGISMSPAEAGEIARMRQKQVAERAGTSGDSRLEYKYSSGGLTDIEYAVQALQLRCHIYSTNTLEALDMLCHNGMIGPDEDRAVKTGYRLIRELEKWNYLLFEKKANKLPTDEKQLAFLARFCKLRSTEDLLFAVSGTKKQNHLFYSKTIGKLRDG